MFEKSTFLYSKYQLVFQPISNFQFVPPNIERYEGKVKSILAKSSELDELKWKVGDELNKKLDDLIFSEAFKSDIKIEKN